MKICPIRKKGRPQNHELKKKVRALAEQGFNFAEIAKSLGLKSRQLARYHYEKGNEK